MTLFHLSSFSSIRLEIKCELSEILILIQFLNYEETKSENFVCCKFKVSLNGLSQLTVDQWLLQVYFTNL